MNEHTFLLKILIVLYLTLNLISFTAFAIDKRKAIKNKWRISENTLIFVSVLGIFGGLLGMLIMHHKTKKLKFRIFIPTIFIIEAVSVLFFMFYFT